MMRIMMPPQQESHHSGDFEKISQKSFTKKPHPTQLGRFMRTARRSTRSGAK
jgi:hypothetical protein